MIKNLFKLHSFCLVLFSVLPISGEAADWNQLRGLNGQGQGGNANVPLTWSETENVAWKTALPGTGWSSPVVSEGVIWVTTATDDGHSLRAVAVQAESGKLLQNVEVFAPEEPAPINDQNSFASPTPVVEPGFVYVHFGTMGTACLNSQTGDVVWKHSHLQLDHKEGPGSSPILFEDLLLINCDGMDVQYVAALDKRTGETVWKTDRSAPFRERPDFKKAYSTPVVHQVNGRWQLISMGADQMQAYDVHTGKEIWQIRYNGFSNVPLVLVEGDVGYITTGFTRPQLWAIDLTGEGNVTEENVLWTFKRQVPQKVSPIKVGEHLYFVSDKGVGCCVVAKTGEAVWQDRIGGNYSSSPIAVNGMIYFSNHEGETKVVSPGTKLEIVAENKLDGVIKATPAVWGDSLILRTDSHLYRISE